MPICDNCGTNTRTPVPVLTPPPSQVSAFWAADTVIPRAAMTPEQDAAIPWGEHPQDNRFGTLCPECAAVPVQT